MSSARSVVAGLLVIGLSIALAQFSMFGLLGLMLIPVAALFTLWCIWKARGCAGELATHYIGLVAWVAAMAAHIGVNFTVLTGAHMVALAAQRGRDDVVVTGSGDAIWWLVTVALTAAGARLWFGADPNRAVFWGIGVGMISPVALILFLLLSDWLPLSA